MFLGENGAEIVRINSSVVAIPLFGIDVPSSSQRVRFASESSRLEPDDHVKGAEVLGPVDLSTSEHPRRRKVLKILMVRYDVDRCSSSLKVVSPDAERFKNG